MRPGFIVSAILMLLYLIASFLGSGDIGILYIGAKAAQAFSGGRVPFQGAYEAGIALYIIVMLCLFAAGSRGGKN